MLWREGAIPEFPGELRQRQREDGHHVHRGMLREMMSREWALLPALPPPIVPSVSQPKSVCCLGVKCNICPKTGVLLLPQCWGAWKETCGASRSPSVLEPRLPGQTGITQPLQKAFLQPCSDRSRRGLEELLGAVLNSSGNWLYYSILLQRGRKTGSSSPGTTK